jgi:hypothetical protein
MAISKKARWAAARAASAGLAGAVGWRFGDGFGRIGFTGGPRETWLTRHYRVDRYG